MSRNGFPSGPKSWLPFKIFNSFRSRPLEFLEEMRRHGDVSYVKLGSQHIFLISKPELIKEVLLDTSGRFTKGRALGRAKVLLGEGLLTSEDALHTRQKRLMMPAFHRQRIPLYGEMMITAAEKCMASWKEGQVLDLWQEMMRTTLEIAASTLFGAHLESEANEISAALTDIMVNFDLISFPGADLLRYLPLPSSIKFNRAHRHLDEVVYRIIRERRESKEEGEDLLAMLLAAQDEEDGSKMSDQQVRDEVMTLFLAGHETTSNALSWAWYLLAKHPEVMGKLHDEIDRVGQGRRLAASDFSQLKYTEMVFAEAIRLYPPAWVMGRRSREGTELGGWEIPKMSILLISQWVMHRDKTKWDDPEAFRPERFTAEAKANREAYIYFPFSAGPRGCIGEGFAWMEGVLLLASIAQKWNFKLEEGAAIQPLAQITLRPRTGVPLRLLARRIEAGH